MVRKTTLATANQNRDYRIFEEFAFFMMDQARAKRVTDIFNLGGHIKVHTLFDIETQVPASYHITEAKVHDSKAIKTIPLEVGSYYIFDRGYNAFKELYKIN